MLCDITYVCVCVFVGVSNKKLCGRASNTVLIKQTGGCGPKQIGQCRSSWRYLYTWSTLKIHIDKQYTQCINMLGQSEDEVHAVFLLVYSHQFALKGAS